VVGPTLVGVLALRVVTALILQVTPTSVLSESTWTQKREKQKPIANLAMLDTSVALSVWLTPKEPLPQP
jgi:hypothetical protein